MKAATPPYIISYCTVFLLLFCSLAGSQSTELQRLVLIDLINAIPELSKHGWSSSSVEFACDYATSKLGFSGLMCTEKKIIVGIDLSNRGLSGTIPETLELLGSSLERLDLSNNSLTGPFPSAIRGLTSLKYLSLSNNRFAGAIPSWIGTLTSLSHLECDGNLFAGTIPSEISNLTNLEYLSISYEDANIPVELGQLIKLKELHLGYSTRQETLPDIFSTMKVLETLTIGPRKNLQGSIPDSLFNMKSLVSVQIFETSLAGELLPFASDKITKLHLQNNQFKGQFPNYYLRIPSLISLNLSSNMLFSAMLNISANSKLTHLYLDDLMLSGNIPQEISLLEKLEVFSAKNNRFNGSVPSVLWSMPNLRYLNLNGNLLTGELPEINAYTTVLEVVDLSNNNLFGTIPKSWADWKSVKELYLQNNHLGEKLPPYTKWDNLVVLDLSSNEFDGEIPPKGQKLLVLNLSNNKFRGVCLPESVPQICDLTGALHSFYCCYGDRQLRLCGVTCVEKPACLPPQPTDDAICVENVWTVSHLDLTKSKQLVLNQPIRVQGAFITDDTSIIEATPEGMLLMSQCMQLNGGVLIYHLTQEHIDSFGRSARFKLIDFTQSQATKDGCTWYLSQLQTFVPPTCETVSTSILEYGLSLYVEFTVYSSCTKRGRGDEIPEPVAPPTSVPDSANNDDGVIATPTSDTLEWWHYTFIASGCLAAVLIAVLIAASQIDCNSTPTPEPPPHNLL